jgi:methionyl-tRNA synthetase
VEEREEENYYFRLIAHPSLPLDPKQWLLEFIDQRSRDGNPFDVPDFRVGELRNAVEKLEGDLCISRPKSRLSWGIEFPFDPNFVTYVWFDALVNYISFTGYDPNAESMESTIAASPEFVAFHGTIEASAPSFRILWPALHVIGKDILIPAHGVYWPIMLKALGFADEDMPTLLVHGWWNIAGTKMSKSLGNIVDPDALADKYSAEAVRYYLMSDIATGRDADFSEERLVQRYNGDLANSIGNLLNRTLNMAAKYRSGSIRNAAFTWGEWDDPDLKRVVANLPSHNNPTFVRQYGVYMEKGAISMALQLVSEVATLCNGFIEVAKPWKMVKNPHQAENLDATLYYLAEFLRIFAILISPVLPKAAAGIFTQLNCTGPMTLAEAEWGKLPDGHQLGQPRPLFPRIEVPHTIS